jgi:succinate dehydrogenase / fumarate reductase membrane anchor subunit
MGCRRRGHFARIERHTYYPHQFWGWSDSSETTLLWLHDHSRFCHPDFYRAYVLGHAMSQSAPSSYVSAPRPGETTWIWLIKIATGPLLVLVLILHFTVNHYLGSMSSGLMTYADVIKYFQNPIIPAIEILFLITVVTHCLVGLRGIILDMNPSRPVLRAVTWLLSLLGVSSVIYGIWLALTIAAKGG